METSGSGVETPAEVSVSGGSGVGPSPPSADLSPSTSATAAVQLDAIAAAAAALTVASSSSSGTIAAHPNLFVRGLPLAWSEAEIAAVFGQHGSLTSIRLVRHSVTKHSLGYGFVRFSSVAEAQSAIASLDGNAVLGHTLQVKFADADAGPPSTAVPSGLTPSDSCYVKHLPATYGVQEVQHTFEPHGAVLDVKLFPCLDQFRGASALVRMASVEAAERAITALNNTTPPGAVQTLIVRYAESAAEKAARLSRREMQSLQRAGAPPAAGAAGLTPLINGVALPGEQQLHQTLSALSLNGGVHAAAVAAAAAGLRPPMPPAPLVPQPYHPAVQSSVCIKGMPGNADRLWLYENFARFGAVAGLRILIDESTGLCNGTGFVNYADPGSAEKARQAMNGMRVGDKILHVMVQQNMRSGAVVATATAGACAAASAAAASPPVASPIAAPAAVPIVFGMQPPPMPSMQQGEWHHILPPAVAGGATVW
eukprot:scaffold2.g7204.t1